MRYREIARTSSAKWQDLLNIVTLFVPRGQADALIAVCQQHDGRIIQTRALPQFGGYSEDVRTGCPDSAASLLAGWINRSQAISDTVQSGKTVLDTLSDLLGEKGAL